MAQIMGGETSTWLTIGVGGGLVIALVSGAAVYQAATTTDTLATFDYVGDP